jgi:hypothetical protein
MFTKSFFLLSGLTAGLKHKAKACNVLCLIYIAIFNLAVTVYPLCCPKYFRLYLLYPFPYLNQTIVYVKCHGFSLESLFFLEVFTGLLFSALFSLCLFVTAQRLFSIIHILSWLLLYTHCFSYGFIFDFFHLDSAA